MLLTALEGQGDLKFWLKFGGREALASYGYSGVAVEPAALRRLIPSDHIQFLKKCRNYYETVRHFFVHAYYDPERSLYEQNWNALRWANLPPTPQPHGSGKGAIVGHTPQRSGD